MNSTPVRICPKCGTENQRSRTLCSACSTSLAKVPLSAGVTSNQTVAVGPARPPTMPPAPPATNYFERPQQPVEPKKSSAGAWLAIIALIVIVGGGLGGYSFLASKQKSGLKPDAKLRALMPGDQFTYDLEASSEVNDNPLLGNHGKGMAVYKIVDYGENQPKDNLRRFRVMMEMGSAKGANTIQESRYAQDAANNLYYLGEYRGPQMGWDTITDQQLPIEMPSAPVGSKGWSYTAHFQSGAVRSFTCKNMGVETVDTPMGRFEAVKFHCKQTSSEGLGQEGDVWVTPWCPFGVKADLKASMSIGGLSIKARIKVELTKCSFKP